MAEYYIRIPTWGTTEPHIIDEAAIEQAERGVNYLNPDDFMFLYEAESIEDAEVMYWEEFSRYVNDLFAESMHR